ncbi:unnamed protein product [Hyaloperonospora brassicae]|uniref:BZIP domain-containing protein n=1 Tax=Hyaloperonospora brassicae TaxID=162125 RepID=A0AAV0UPS9_HYABA|nr:unnamed protein product [Hyaloperonospora brassicae]
MDTCILHQPSSRVLSETSIANVVSQRDSSFGDTAEVPGGYATHRDFQWSSGVAVQASHASVEGHYQDVEHWHQEDQVHASHGSTLCLDRKRNRHEVCGLRIPASMLSSAARTNAAVAKMSSRVALYQASMQDWFIDHEKQQREIRRTRQIKYRQKQQDNMAALEDSIHQIQLDISKLDQRRRAFATAIPTEMTLWNVAVDYFRLFRFGRQPIERAEKLSTSPMSTPSVQLDFLRSTMAPDVLYNDGSGVEAIMSSWKHFSLCFRDAEVDLTGLEKSGVDTLIASTTTAFCIDQQTLTRVFPHLCGEGAGRVELQLADKLLGRAVVMRGLTRFEWDIGYGRVTRMTTESDLLTPMLELLGTLEDVVLVCGKALVSLNLN